MPTITRTGFTSVSAVITSVANDMITMGFAQVFPTPGGTSFTTPTNPAQFQVVLDATITVDPLVATQPWRVEFNVATLQTVSMYVATPTQIGTDGTVSGIVAPYPSTSPTIIDYSGCIGDINSSMTPILTNPATGFFNRGSRIGATTQNSYPVSYCLSVTPRGFALAIWEEANDDQAAQSSWVVVQRPVDRLTGQALATGKAPLFCVNSVGGKYWKFVVREADINRPTVRLPADTTTTDSTAVINSLQQVAIDESGKYIINFPCRLNTQRYAYTQELDMLGYTSADVVSQFTQVPVTVYGESSPRTYQSLFANGVNDTNLRILFLASGGGI